MVAERYNTYEIVTHDFAQVAAIFEVTWQMHGEMLANYMASELAAYFIPVATMCSFGGRQLCLRADAMTLADPQNEDWRWTLAGEDNLDVLICYSSNSASSLMVTRDICHRDRWRVSLSLPVGADGVEYRGLYATRFFKAAETIGEKEGA